MSERGDIILAGLIKMVAGILLGALVLFEVGAVAVNHVQLDDKARDAAKAAAVAYRDDRRPKAAEEAAAAEVGVLPGTVIKAIDIDDPYVTVSLRREATVIVADRLPWVQDRLVAEATARARSVR